VMGLGLHGSPPSFEKEASSVLPRIVDPLF
jgi:hypothetical protein